MLRGRTSRNITLEQAECVKLLYMENNHSLVLTTQSVFQSMNHSVCLKKGMKTETFGGDYAFHFMRMCEVEIKRKKKTVIFFSRNTNGYEC